jgi:tripartite-type tricarboxylate transporter receptor subunit TctC
VGEFVPGYEASAWQGVGVPKNTPAKIIEKLNREIDAVVADLDTKTRLVGHGLIDRDLARGQNEFAQPKIERLELAAA